MDTYAYRLQAKTAKALAHPTRIAILEMLRGGEKCVCEMEPKLGASQANISQHLVVGQRDRVNDERVFQVLDLLAAIRRDQLNQARQALAALESVGV